MGGQFSSTRQPTKRRGKGARALIIEALKRAGKSETAALDRLVEIAFDDESPAMQSMLVRICEILAPVGKPSFQNIEFDLNTKLSPVEQVRQVLKAVSDGEIPADIGATVVAIIKDGMVVQDISEIAKDLEELKKWRSGVRR
ncbi:MAG: hypothetical protein ACKO0Z_07840 [Betaproteobacteria bacterium]